MDKIGLDIICGKKVSCARGGDQFKAQSGKVFCYAESLGVFLCERKEDSSRQRQGAVGTSCDL